MVDVHGKDLDWAWLLSLRNHNFIEVQRNPSFGCQGGQHRDNDDDDVQLG